jgi:DNA-binding MarR family transcriptional regulator
MKTGLSPSHAFLMMLATDYPGIGQKELSERLHLAPSTVTRFIDSLVHKGYLTPPPVSTKRKPSASACHQKPSWSKPIIAAS